MKEKKEKITLKMAIKRTILGVFISYVIVTSLIGSIGVYNFIIVNEFERPGILFTGGNMFGLIFNLKSNFMSQEDSTFLEDIALNITKGCENEECKVKSIYNELNTYNGSFEYEIGEDMNPINIWNEKKGDCDEISRLMLSLSSSLDIWANIQCSENHCWLIIKPDNKTIIVDIVNKGYYKVK